MSTDAAPAPPVASAAPAGRPADPETYDVHAAQARWRPVWERLDLYRTGRRSGERRYVLDMFPYPSGDLHMGHAEAYAIGDMVARYRMQRGDDVLHPIGWDSFGLPAENAAIRRGEHPAEWTYANIETQAESFAAYGVSFDWSRRLHTSDSEYYRWQQWLFTRFLERGLAERRASAVNWCPTDQTVLANEQVVGGRCERCGSVVTRRELTQWFLRITDYADRLLEDMAQLEGRWPERVLLMQRNWIGRSTGADVDFDVVGGPADGTSVTVYTTRPDTLLGATFFVVAADAPLAPALCSPERRQALEDYRRQTSSLSEVERQETDRPKTGVPLGVEVTNPLSGERLPVWAADYVLSGYGTGAIMAVPAHDQRDLDFARAFGLPVRVVVDTGEPDPAGSGVATTGDGVLVASGFLDGLRKDAAVPAAIAELERRGTGRAAVNFRLRDWLVSRQRYWGCPIPVVHCPQDGAVPVPDDELPVALPDLRGEELVPRGESPLASARDWVDTTCPRCGGPAERDTDTMDTFVDSSWYFLRFCSPGYADGPFDPEAVRRWMPVDAYVGGVEHAILHLLYARFVTKVLHDLGMVDVVEPFASLLNQGQVVMDGAAMSKSKGNMVLLGGELDAYGVDAVRTTMVFASPPEDDVDWADVSPGGSLRWLSRVWRLAGDVGAAGAVDRGSASGTRDAASGDRTVRAGVHRLVDDATRLLEATRLNVVVARMQEMTNLLRRAVDTGPGPADPAVVEGVHALLRLLSTVAPYTAEDGWARLGHDVEAGDSVHLAGWPEVEPGLLVVEEVTCVVQVAGKVRDRLQVPPGVDEDTLRDLALASPGVRRSLGDREVRRVVVRPPGLVNVVPA